MSINVTLRELVGSTYSFNELNQTKFRGKLSFKISRAIKAVQPELDTYREAHQAIRDIYYEDVEVEVEIEPGQPEKPESEEPKTVSRLIEGKEEKDFIRELDELLDTEVELGIEPMLQKPFETLEITPLVLTGLLWWFKD